MVLDYQVGPTSTGKCPLWEAETRGEGSVKLETETGVMWLQTRPRGGKPEPREAGRLGQRSPLEPSSGARPCRQLLHFSSPELWERTHLCCFSRPVPHVCYNSPRKWVQQHHTRRSHVWILREREGEKERDLKLKRKEKKYRHAWETRPKQIRQQNKSNECFGFPVCIKLVFTVHCSHKVCNSIMSKKATCRT